MRENKRKTLVGLFATIFIMVMLIGPVHAWSDIGVEYVDDVDPIYGVWYSSENDAVEGLFGWWYAYQVEFEIWYVDQSADVYKIRIDFDSAEEGSPEALHIYYRWGSSGGWAYLTYCQATGFDTQFTITDASSTTLEIRLIDDVTPWDYQRDVWHFGREPELWMYWY